MQPYTSINADTHRLELDLSRGNARVDRLQSEVAELRSQLMTSQAEIRALRLEVDRQSDPVNFWLRVLDGAPFVLLLVSFLVVAHGVN
jgi:predicted RNase H-like nuclease (RuvC/YqgF family)